MKVVELTCEECGRTFTRTKREHRLLHFCSRECRGPSPPRGPSPIPWLKPRDMKEQMLAEMICGAAIEYQKTLPDNHDHQRIDQHAGEDYWTGYWSALIDYGRRVFDVRAYHGPGGSLDDQESAAPEEDGALAVPEEALPDV